MAEFFEIKTDPALRNESSEFVLVNHCLESLIWSLIEGTNETILPYDGGDRSMSWLTNTCIGANIVIREKIGDVLMDL